MKNPFTITSEINKWGNSLGIRLPKVFCDLLNLHAGAKISISLTKKKIILQKNNLLIKKNRAKSTSRSKKTINKKNFNKNSIATKEIW